MNFGQLARNAERFTEDNSPAILTGIAVVGTVATAYLAAKASFKAVDVLHVDETSRRFYAEEATAKTKAKAVWKLYIPAASAGVLTIVCIIGSNQIGNRRTAAVAAAYTITDRAYNEYREKVVEKFGANKEQAARDEIARDRVNNTPGAEVIVVGSGKVLCCDLFTRRYFESSMEEIKAAQNWINFQITHQNYASLGDFYGRLGLEATGYSEEVGWNGDHLMDLYFSSILSDDNRPCLAIDFTVHPVRHYYKFGG